MRILANTRKWFLGVLHKFSICIVNESLLPIVIPSSLTSLLDFTLLFSIINVILLLSMSAPRNIIWNLPGFATMLLILIQSRIKCVSLDSFRVASSKFGEHEYIVVSSAKLQTSVFWMKNIKSFIKRLNDIVILEYYSQALFINFSAEAAQPPTLLRLLDISKD